MYVWYNVCPNFVMLALNDLIDTSLHKQSNITICHQWISLFVMHTQS
jgi:hypothetical protein